jgi:hypothetical protein
MFGRSWLQMLGIPTEFLGFYIVCPDKCLNIASYESLMDKYDIHAFHSKGKNPPAVGI